jgi:hypothetical protein
MTIALREAQIIRVRGEGIPPDLSKTLSERLHTVVVDPKLRQRNRERDWQILERYQNGMTSSNR